MLALSQGAIRLTLPISPEEVQITGGNEIETFQIITGQEKTAKPVSKLKRVSFNSILPRYWTEIWETDSKQTVTYKTPETTWKLLEQWKAKPIVLNFENLFTQTMLIENLDPTYKDGQGNIYLQMSFVEYSPVKIIQYSNTKQLLKPGVIITKAATSRANTTGKSQTNKKKSDKAAKAAAKTAADNKKGAFDYTSTVSAQKNKIDAKIQQY